MKNLIWGLLAGAGCLVGCADEENEVPVVKIAPTIVRVTGLHFDTGDRIGLSVTRTSGTYLDNQLMTFDGSYFSSAGVLWYKDANEASTLTAYYPYEESGMPTSFSVRIDQSAGCASSNLLAAVKKDVRPSTAAVGMTFSSLMAGIRITLTNETEAVVKKVTVSGVVPTARVDLPTLAATVDSGVDPAEITACPITEGSVYEAIVVPQRAALTVTVYTDGDTHSKTLVESMLEPNKQYTTTVLLTEKGLDLTLSGDIENWQPGGELVEEEGALLSYQGEDYRTVEIDGRVWMAENMRWLPAENLLQAGVWYPSKAGSACSDAEYIKEKGLLYNYAAATGGATASAEGFVQGICPQGWHIPNDEEFTSLLSASLPEGFAVGGGYWIESLQTYFSTGIKGYLLGVTSAAESGKYNYLSLENNTATKITPILEANGVSLRCVKDAR